MIQSILNKENFTIFEQELQNYEEVLRKAFEAGVSIRPEEQIAKWTILRAVFFSSTVLTTIGMFFLHITPQIRLHKFPSPSVFVLDVKIYTFFSNIPFLI